MSEQNVDMFVTSVLNSMLTTLDDEQLKILKDQLYIHLRDVDISKKCYDLIELSDSNDANTLKMFIASERVRKLSEKTITQYVRAVMHMRTSVGKNFVDIDSVDIEAYLATCSYEKQWATNTLLNNIHDLCAFFVSADNAATSEGGNQGTNGAT